MRQLVECVMNFSEGQRVDVIDQIVNAIDGRISGYVCPENPSVSTVVIVVGTLKSFADLANATTLFLSVCLSIL